MSFDPLFFFGDHLMSLDCSVLDIGFPLGLMSIPFFRNLQFRCMVLSHFHGIGIPEFETKKIERKIHTWSVEVCTNARHDTTIYIYLLSIHTILPI